ncbi:oligosaccharide flippase family protein [Halolamina rubra]|uniref:oligosaccharide flippase family protein n=1 Tax=Halolamina rubra TaxID=1380430 RepID=UPI0009E51F97|nr:oligosaccharide flippase family protein [Halolamina rubra]
MDNDDDEILSVSEGAGWFLGGHVIKQSVSLCTNVIITNILGATLYGVYAYLKVLLSVVRVFCKLGSKQSVLRFLPEYRDEGRDTGTIITLAYGTSLVISIIFSLLIYILSPMIASYTIQSQIFINTLRIIAIVIPSYTLSNITISIFQSIGRMEYNILISSVLDPVFRLVFVGSAVILGFSVVGATAGLVVASIIVFIIGIWLLRVKTDILYFEVPEKREVKKYYNYSIPMTFNEVGNFLYNRVDIFMIAWFLSAEDIGVYNIAVTVAGLLILPLTAFNQLFPPIASRLYHNKNIEELSVLYQRITRLVLTISIVPAIILILYSQEVLHIFGEEFTQGSMILILFSASQLVNCIVGPSGYLLMMADHQYITFVNQVSSGILNVLLNIVLILEFGVIGAAIATATTLALINGIRLLQVYHFIGITPYSHRLSKPIISGLISAIIMGLVKSVLSHTVLLVVGSMTGMGVFLTLLYLFGIEEEDKVLLSQLLSQFQNIYD